MLKGFKLVVFYAVVITLVLMPGLVIHADDDISGVYSGTFSELGISDGKGNDVDDDEVNIPFPTVIHYFYYSGNESGVNYGTQLTGNAKNVYDALSKINSSSTHSTVYLSNILTFYSATTSPTDAELKSTMDTISNITQMGIDAFCKDHPEIFWLDINNGRFKFTYYGKQSGSRYVWTINQLDYNLAVASEYSGSVSNAYNSLNTAVNSFSVSGATRYEKVKSIHDSLCSRVSYLETTYAHEAYGALIKGKAVCEGYAKAFKLICDKQSIPCIIVRGKSVNNAGETELHAWNYIKMEDGKWYAVDSTWDDQSKIFYDYFLVGSNSIANNFDRLAFRNTHIASGDFSDTGIFSFSYPTLESEAYKPANAVTSTPKPTATPVLTATPVPTPTPVPVENPELGDVNSNGVINADDALFVLRVAADFLPMEEPFMTYGDVNKDGLLNASDALLILKYSANLINTFE